MARVPFHGVKDLRETRSGLDVILPTGHQTHLRPKGKGEISMPGKRVLTRNRLGQASQDPGDMVKPGLVEPQSPRCNVEQAGYNGCISGSCASSING